MYTAEEAREAREYFENVKNWRVGNHGDEYLVECYRNLLESIAKWEARETCTALREAFGKAFGIELTGNDCLNYRYGYRCWVGRTLYRIEEVYRHNGTEKNVTYAVEIIKFNEETNCSEKKAEVRVPMGASAKVIANRIAKLKAEWEG